MSLGCQTHNFIYHTTYLSNDLTIASRFVQWYQVRLNVCRITKSPEYNNRYFLLYCIYDFILYSRLSVLFPSELYGALVTDNNIKIQRLALSDVRSIPSGRALVAPNGKRWDLSSLNVGYFLSNMKILAIHQQNDLRFSGSWIEQEHPWRERLSHGPGGVLCYGHRVSTPIGATSRDFQELLRNRPNRLRRCLGLRSQWKKWKHIP